ncbi:hypothetical protein JW930_05835 [Candidatus Woesearchaeota archaeon]|nr:hypothetical protein [Candidatus Woesearchaeota archaeon]
MILKKKGQLSLLIIILIICLLILVSVIFLIAKTKKSEVESSIKDSFKIVPTKESIKAYVEMCLYDTALPAVYYISKRGGYIDLPAESILTPNINTAYYYYLGADKMPTLESIENEISHYVEQTLFICINDLRPFKDMSRDINLGEFSVDTTIGKNSVFIKLTYPIELSTDNTKVDVTEYTTTIPLRLGLIYDYAKQVNNELIVNRGTISSDFFNNFEVHSVIMPSGAKTIFLLKDDQTGNNLPPLMFYFASIKI